MVYECPKKLSRLFTKHLPCGIKSYTSITSATILAERRIRKMKKKDAKPYMGSVKVGPKGQIVIPKEIRDMFDIEPGQSLMIMAHPQRGIAIERQSVLVKMADAIFAGKGREVYPYEDPEHLDEFAKVIKKNAESGEEEQ